MFSLRDLRGNLLEVLPQSSLSGLNENLVHLDLSKNNLRNIDVDAFRGLKRLRTLNLRRNHLRSIPKGLDEVKLHKLDLRLNLISSLSPADVMALSQIRSVDLSRNFIKDWPRVKERITNFTSKIEKLDLASNLLPSLHSGIFSTLSSLQTLRLTRNKIKSIESHTFRGMGALQSIDLSKNLIRSLPSLAFHNLRSLVNLSLVRNEISRLDDGAFFGCESLLALNLSQNHIRTISDEWLFGLNGLQELDIKSRSGTINGQELASAELLLLDVSMSDKAEYQCVVRNRFAAEHSIRSVLKIFQVPIFSNEPDDMSLLVGQNAKIMCAATGIPAPVIKWSKDGGASFPAALQHRLFVRPNDDHLYVVNVTTEDQGVYTCHAVNEAGAIQASATLRIFENSFNVTLKDTIICMNDTLLLDCYADLAHPSQRMEWTFDGEPLFVDGERVSLKAHGQILAIKKIQLSDAGEYACEMWAGNDQLARQVAKVVVVGREEIRTDPNSQEQFIFRPYAVLLGLISAIVFILALIACCLGIGRVWSSRKVRDRPENV
nr:Leucine-rich repeat and Immunoglobulin I-set and Immunoglobulin V-set domain containing protein [Haemonchus contortus]